MNAIEDKPGAPPSGPPPKRLMSKGDLWAVSVMAVVLVGFVAYALMK